MIATMIVTQGTSPHKGAEGGIQCLHGWAGAEGFRS